MVLTPILIEWCHWYCGGMRQELEMNFVDVFLTVWATGNGHRYSYRCVAPVGNSCRSQCQEKQFEWAILNRQELPSGKVFCRPAVTISCRAVPDGLFLTVGRQKHISWRFSVYSWRFLAVRIFPGSGSVLLEAVASIKASLNVCFMRVSYTLNRMPHKQNCWLGKVIKWKSFIKWERSFISMKLL